MNILWSFIRKKNSGEQNVPSWTGFNILIRNHVTVVKDKIGYLPTINASATKLFTVNEILHNILKIMQALSLEEIVCVFDQTLYAKAAEIVWKHKDKFKSVVLRMGVFHTIINFIPIIGKRFGPAGLRDLVVECNIVTDGSINSVLEGRQYNHVARMCKLIYEALLRLAWKEFIPWMESCHQLELSGLKDAEECLLDLQANVRHEKVTDVLQNPAVVTILNRFTEFLDHLHQGHGQLASFWMSFVDMVESLLGLIRASHEGEWKLHLLCIRSIIPWFFAYDKQNYVRCASVYYSQMTQLGSTHPKVRFTYPKQNYEC